MSKITHKPKNKNKRSETPDRKIYLSSNSQKLKDELKEQSDQEENNTSNLIIEDSYVPNLRFSDLLFNVNDGFKTLITKNTKLRSLLIEANDHINEITKTYESKLELFSNEKKNLLKQLDKITINYTIYAESHKNLSLIKEEYDRLNSEFSVCQDNLMVYKELIK